MKVKARIVRIWGSVRVRNRYIIIGCYILTKSTLFHKLLVGLIILLLYLQRILIQRMVVRSR
jgi:hypothetical protein